MAYKRLVSIVVPIIPDTTNGFFVSASSVNLLTHNLWELFLSWRHFNMNATMGSIGQTYIVIFVSLLSHRIMWIVAVHVVAATVSVAMSINNRGGGSKRPPPPCPPSSLSAASSTPGGATSPHRRHHCLCHHFLHMRRQQACPSHVARLLVQYRVEANVSAHGRCREPLPASSATLEQICVPLNPSLSAH